MAAYLLDTNILLRSCDPGSGAHRAAVDAVAALLLRGDDLCIAPQNVIEFWVVATRPADVNGLGWDPERAAAEVDRLLDQFELLEAHPDAFSHWLRLVTSHESAASGRMTHTLSP